MAAALRPALCLVLVSGLALVLPACTSPRDASAPGNGGTVAPQESGSALEAVQIEGLPGLASVAPAVRTQIESAFAALQVSLSNPSATTNDRAERYGALGHLLLAATFFDEAVLCYRHAGVLQPGEARWPYLEGHASLRKGDRESAARAFERTLALQPDYVPALVWLGDVDLDLGRADLAQRSFDTAVARQPGSAAALFGAGRAALARRSYDDAAQYMERALQAEPGASAIRYPLAMAYRGAGQRDKAEALLRTRGSVAPPLPDPLLESADVVLDSAVSFEGAGMDALRRQDWRAAIDSFRRGLAVAPGDASLRYWMATALLASGDAASAEREFRTVTREQPGFANAHFSLGAMLDQRGLLPEALREYDAAVQAAPTMPEARLRLADALARAGQPRKAMDQYEEAVRLDPSVAQAWIGGARALIAMKQVDAARSWLARARRVLPADRDLAALESGLR